MKWRTAISTHKNGEFLVRGKKLTELIESRTFTEAIFLVLKGSLPNGKEKAMLDAVLVACIEHGIQVPSAFISRGVASTGNPVNAALAAGILAIGEWHGGAIEKAAQMLQSGENAEDIVKNALAGKERIAGYGHKIYKEKDPRAEAIFVKARELGFGGAYMEKAAEIEKELKKQSGKTLPINVDGAVAAVISEMGFDWRIGKSFFILGRLPGLAAHVAEETANEKPYRRIDDEDVEYAGTETNS